jgi:hypothetical protein
VRLPRILFSLAPALFVALALAASAEAWRRHSAHDPDRDRAERGEVEADESDDPLGQYRYIHRPRAFPFEHIPIGARHRARLEALDRRAEAARAPFSPAGMLSSLTWAFSGPQPTTWTNQAVSFSATSGRVTAIAIDPAHPSTVYLGGAEGGVWKSTNSGSNWAPLTDDQPSLAIGSIAIDPRNSQNIFVGTGEGNFSGDSYYGAGILRSTDGGATWTAIGSPFAGPLAGWLGGATIGAIAVSPSNGQIVLASASAFSNNGSGVYRSTDGGSTWNQVLTTMNAFGMDVRFDPSNGMIAYAVIGNIWTGVAEAGVYKSTDGGATWTQLGGGFPANVGRAVLAIAASRPTTIYASVGGQSTQNGDWLGMYKTIDGGASWTQLTAAPQYCRSQCYYDQAIAVHPHNPNIVFIAGVGPTSNMGQYQNEYVTLDGGASWSLVSAANGEWPHTDGHALAFTPDGTTLYLGSDGGVWRTNDTTSASVNWANLNQTLALTQFYPGMSIDAADLTNAFAGAQDNGTQFLGGAPQWDGTTVCGDGGYTAMDPTDTSILYASCAGGQPYYYLQKSTSGMAGPWTSLVSGIDTNDHLSFVPPLALDPNSPTTLYFGTNHVYQSIDGAQSWNAMANTQDFGTAQNMGNVIAINVAPSNGDTVYVATDDGNVWVTSNASQGTAATFTLRTAGLPNRSPTSFAVDPTNAGTVYIGFSGFTGFGGDMLGHLFQSTDSGAHWQDITGDLPNTPVNDIALDPMSTSTIYVATDVGIMVSTDHGAHWGPIGAGLPNVLVLDLRFHAQTRTLRAATHGRGVWDLVVPPPLNASATSLSVDCSYANGAPVADTLTITNPGGSAMVINAIAVSANFAETHTCGPTLGPNQSCTVAVTYAPTTVGNLSGTVRIDYAGLGSPLLVPVSGSATGSGGPAVMLAPNSVDFGTIRVGTTANQNGTLTNNGGAPLALTSITTQGAGFGVSDDCPVGMGSLAVGASCHWQVSYAPTAAGMDDGTLTFAGSACLRQVTAPLHGVAAVPTLQVSPDMIDFGSLPLGMSSPRTTVTLSNTGLVPVNVSGAHLVAGQSFQLVGSCTGALAPGASCTLSVTFAPLNAGTISDQLHIDDDATGAPHTVPLMGTGLTEKVSLSPSALVFSAQQVGSPSAPQAVTLSNVGSGPVAISGLMISSEFGVAQNGCPSTLPAGASCTIQVTFTPSGTGDRSGTLSISDQAMGSPQMVMLSGIGTTTFTLTPAGPTALSVEPGQVAMFTLVVAGLPAFMDDIQLTCTSSATMLPCQLDMQNLTLSGTASQAVALTVGTKGPKTGMVSGMISGMSGPPGWLARLSGLAGLEGLEPPDAAGPLLLGLLGMLLAYLLLTRLGFATARVRAGVLAIGVCAACGDSSGNTTASGSYEITVTAQASHGDMRQATFTVNVGTGR